MAWKEIELSWPSTLNQSSFPSGYVKVGDKLKETVWESGPLKGTCRMLKVEDIGAKA
jgi:hypothetical protein